MKTMEDSLVVYQKLKDFSRQLTSLLEEGKVVSQKLNIANTTSRLAAMAENAQSAFKMIVIGNFQAGKTTLVNAMLGEKILSAHSVPVTGIINNVKYSKNRNVLLHFKNPLPEQLIQNIPLKVQKAIIEGKGNTPLPLKVLESELDEFVIEDQINFMQSPYDRLEIGIDSPLLKNGVEIFDMPGFQYNLVSRSDLSNYLLKADIILFVINSLVAITKSDLDAINEFLRGGVGDSLFVVFNQVDRVPDHDHELFISFCKHTLNPMLEGGNERIFFISGAQALQGRLNNDRGLILNSGIMLLENNIANHLTKERGKPQLQRLLFDFQALIQQELVSAIQFARYELSLTTEELHKRQVLHKHVLTKLDAEKQLIVEKLKYDLASMEISISRMIDLNFEKIIATTPFWVHEISIHSNFLVLKPKESAQLIVEEIIEKFQRHLEVEQYRWMDEDIMPAVIENFERSFKNCEEQIKSFYKLLYYDNGFRNQLTDSDALKKVLDLKSTSFYSYGLERNVDYLVLPELFFKQTAIQLVALISIPIIGVINPLTIFPAIIAMAVAGSYSSAGTVTGSLRKAVASKAVEKLREMSPGLKNHLKISIIDKLRQPILAVELALSNEIQLRGTYSEKEISALESEVLSQKFQNKEFFDKCENELNAIRAATDELLLLISDL